MCINMIAFLFSFFEGICENKLSCHGFQLFDTEQKK